VWGEAQCFYDIKINMGLFLCSEVRKLKIPPHMGYGDKGVGGAIPGLYYVCIMSVQVFHTKSLFVSHYGSINIDRGSS
jgi:hypothetical protein